MLCVQASVQVYIALYTKKKSHRTNQRRTLRNAFLVIAGMTFRRRNGDILTSFATRSEVGPVFVVPTCARPNFPCRVFEAQYLSRCPFVRRQLVPGLDARPGLYLFAGLVIPRGLRVSQCARGRLFTVAN